MRLAKLARGDAFKFAKVCPQRCVVDVAHRSPRHEYVRPTRLQPLDAADKGAYDPWRTRHVAKLTIIVQTVWLRNGRMSLLEGTTKLIKRVGPPSCWFERTKGGSSDQLKPPGRPVRAGSAPVGAPAWRPGHGLGSSPIGGHCLNPPRPAWALSGSRLGPKVRRHCLSRGQLAWAPTSS